MSKTTKKILNILLVLALVVMAFLIPTFTSETAFADDVKQDASVLQDLHKDEDFDESAYPVVGDDFSLNVIQIAESVDNELYVYVYQPCSPNIDLWATSISISTNPNNPNPQLYDLTLSSVSGVFYRYKVEDFVVTQSAVRYYDIVSILRAWNRKYDAQPDEGQTVNEVAYAVGQSWAAMTHDDTVVYSCTSVDVVTITQKVVGLLRFWDGLHLVNKSTDSHYVAFACDHDMDKLLEADVSYAWATKVQYSEVFGIVQGEQVLDSGEDSVTLHYDTVVSNGDGWFAKKYVWNQIESVDDFKKDKDLNDSDVNNLAGMQWVLNFLVTDYIDQYPGPAQHSVKITDVSEVIILRLKFEKDGVVYDLGVVDNKQTGSNIPSNDVSEGNLFLQGIQDFWSGLKTTYKVLIIIGLVLAGLVVLAIIIRIVKAIYDLVAEGFQNKKTKSHKNSEGGKK